MDIRRLLDKFFDTTNFTDEQLLRLWEKSNPQMHLLIPSSLLKEGSLYEWTMGERYWAWNWIL